MPLRRSICVFQLSTRSSRSAARTPTLIDSTNVLAELLQPLVFADFVLERAVKVGVFDGDTDVVCQREQQLNIVARKKFAGFGPAHSQKSNGPAADGAGQIVVEIQIGDGLAHRRGPASGHRVQVITGALKEQVRNMRRPAEETEIQRFRRCQRPCRANPSTYADASAALPAPLRSWVRRRQTETPRAGWKASA